MGASSPMEAVWGFEKGDASFLRATCWNFSYCFSPQRFIFAETRDTEEGNWRNNG
jgi:hypothetical protein